MKKLNGKIGVYGTVAYVPQQSWIQNETIRNNITFGMDFDEYFYFRVINACALRIDINNLTNGDMTEIGEKVNTIKFETIKNQNYFKKIYKFYNFFKIFY